MRFLALALAFVLSPLQGMAQSWCAQAPRPSYEQLPRVSVSDPWFQVYQVDPGVFAIYEPYNFQEVISYLIVGRNRALLFDTGMGMSRISTVVRELTRLPVSVVNSHTHYDHVGGNAEFGEILSLDTEFTRESAKGMAHAAVATEATPRALCRERLPLPFDTAAYSIRPFKTSRFIKNGDVIDLGGRTLEVVEVPGHTPDAIALLDRANGLVWTGDTFYEGPIWLFAASTDLDAYGRSIARLADLALRLRQVFPAHNTAVASPARLPQARDAFARVRAGAVAYTDKGDGTVEYPAEGFSFLMRKPEPPPPMPFHRQ